MSDNSGHGLTPGQKWAIIAIGGFVVFKIFSDPGPARPVTPVYQAAPAYQSVVPYQGQQISEGGTIVIPVESPQYASPETHNFIEYRCDDDGTPANPGVKWCRR